MTAEPETSSKAADARRSSMELWREDLRLRLDQWRRIPSLHSESTAGTYGESEVFTGRRTPGRPRAYLIPPASRGSLGDQAYLEATVDLVDAAGFQAVILIDDRARRWTGGLSALQQIALPLHQSARAIPAMDDFVCSSLEHDIFLAIGADATCGAYGEDMLVPWVYVGEAARRGRRAAMISAGFDVEPIRAFQELYAALPPQACLLVRDPSSLDRASAHLGQQLHLAADLAFSWDRPVSTPAPPVLEWLARQREHGRLVILFNVHALLARVESSAERDRGARLRWLMDDAARALEELVAELDASVLLLPHDDRGEDSDVALLNELQELLSTRLRGRVMTVGRVDLPTSRWLAAAADVAVSGRMHLAISCAVGGTPVLSIGYQDKFDGVLSGIGLDGWTISPDEIGVAGLLTDRVRRLGVEAPTLAGRVAAGVADQRRMARRTLDILGRHTAAVATASKERW